MTPKKITQHELRTLERCMTHYEQWVRERPDWRPSEKAAALVDVATARVAVHDHARKTGGRK